MFACSLSLEHVLLLTLCTCFPQTSFSDQVDTAIFLRDKYLRETAVCPITVAPQLKEDAVHIITDRENDVDRHLFDALEENILTMLQSDYIEKFLGEY